MSFYHSKDFSFHIINITTAWHSEYEKEVRGAELTRLIVYLRPNAHSRLWIAGREYPLSNVNMIFLPSNTSFSRRGERERVMIIELEVFGVANDTPEVIAKPKLHTMMPLFRRLNSEWQGKLPGYLIRAHSVLYNIFDKLSRYDEPTGEDKKFDIISNGVKYFNECYTSRDCSIGEAATLCFVGERYFRKIFTEVFGIAPTHYLRELRIRRACELIREGKLPISEIAPQCGFDDPKYFSRVFGNVMNMSPSAFARLAKK